MTAAAAKGAWLATISGLAAATVTAPTGMIDWLFFIPRRSQAWKTALLHMLLMVTTVVLYALAVWCQWPGYLHGDVNDSGLALVCAGVLTMLAGGFMGGSVVFVRARHACAAAARRAGGGCAAVAGLRGTAASLARQHRPDACPASMLRRLSQLAASGCRCGAPRKSVVPQRRGPGRAAGRTLTGGGDDAVIELYQAEWCPHSHLVRQRLTELGLDFVAHQVAADPGERTAIANTTGRRSIPTLVFADGSIVSGEDEILAALDRRFPEPAATGRHREKAIEEWPEWLRQDGG